MRRNPRLHVVLAAATLLAAPVGSSAAPPQLVILRISGKSASPDVLDAATERAAAAALRVSAGRFKVVTRDMLAAIVGEERLLRCEEQSRCELDLGVGLGSGYLLAGSIRKLGATFELTLKLYDVRRLDLLAQDTDTAGREEELAGRVGPLVERLVRMGLALGGPAAVPAQPSGTTAEAPTVETAAAASASAGTMVRLPGATFRNGSRVMTVQPFLLDVTEVTVAAYDACVKAGKCSAAWSTPDWPGITEARRAELSPLCNGARPERARHPVNCVDWNQATAYCAAVGKRLPTKDEWEWAARGAERGTTYPWGNEPPRGQLCWDGEGSDLGEGNRRGTCPVGSYPRGDSPQGLKDLAGNVDEWMSTAFDGDRLVRGGSWQTGHWSNVAAGSSGSMLPTQRGAGLGFRCARTP